MSWFLLSLLSGTILFGSTCLLMARSWKKNWEKELSRQTKLYDGVLSKQQEWMTKQISESSRLVSQAMNLVAAADVISYQQISVMGTDSLYNGQNDAVYDPSPEAEVQRIADRNKLDADQSPEQEALSDYEAQQAREFGFGGSLF